MHNIIEVVEPLRADIASLNTILPDLKCQQPHEAGSTITKSQQSLFRENSRVIPNKKKSIAPPVVGFYPSPLGLLFYGKVNLQVSENEVLDPDADNQLTVKQRTFRLSPSRFFRSLGGQQVEFRIAIRSGFDRVSLKLSTNRPFDSGLIKALGFSNTGPFPGWSLHKPDFSLLRRQLGEGKISANDRFCDRTDVFLRETALLQVSA